MLPLKGAYGKISQSNGERHDMIRLDYGVFVFVYVDWRLRAVTRRR